LQGRLFALLKDLSTIVTVLMFKHLLDLEGVINAFKDILDYVIVIRTSRRLAKGLNFFLIPLLGKLSKLLLLDKD
jgi:hypothetical protein